ncbi:MAG: hypothetical protein Udaeo2_02630 [Candidatus Udaeobacter sp.]|nr:MAG: hypothetical protein Udaeo2_02630 [Candidatus Udaeobacter sp.]
MTAVMQNQFDAALPDFDKAIELKPDDAMPTSFAVLLRSVSTNGTKRSRTLPPQFRNNRMIRKIMTGAPGQIET